MMDHRTTTDGALENGHPGSSGSHTPTPWRVFTTKDGRKLVGIGSQDGEGILDCGFGVWAWDDPAGIANAELVVKAVNNHAALVSALEWYANHYDHAGGFSMWDGGAKARAALAEVK